MTTGVDQGKVEKTCEVCGRLFVRRPTESYAVFGRRTRCSRECADRRRRKRPVAERFWAKVNRHGPDECWPWTAHIDIRGYGQFGWTRKDLMGAHRASYLLAHGSIPDGLSIDHLCHNRDLTCNLGDNCPHRRCVNPAHLEAVPLGTNALRGRSPASLNAAKVECARSHAFDEANTYVRPGTRNRRCRACYRRWREEHRTSK